MTQPDEEPNEPQRPRLWNPSAAANWCLLFSPVFGAYLHAINWRTLGEPERAAANMRWVWGCLVLLVLTLASLFLPESPVLDRAFQFAWLITLITWYFRQAKPQIEHVKQTVGDAYTKKGWGKPLLIASGCLCAYLLVLVVWIGVLVGNAKPTPEQVATQIKPMILEQWQEVPGLYTTTIENISLVQDSDTTYSGTVQATLNGQAQRMLIKVTIQEDSLMWELTPDESDQAAPDASMPDTAPLDTSPLDSTTPL